MSIRRILFLALLVLAALPPSAARAKVDLVTLPDRDRVQLTIYNNADLTLVRESRTLTLRKGENRLQFSWANTLIDPTSLQIFPKAGGGRVRVAELSYPPRVRDVGVWRIDSEVSGKVPFEIIYFISGISWQAYYQALLSPEEKELSLEGYVRVNNRSGEEYEKAQVRLVVGKVNLLDEVAALARRYPPYGRPGPLPAEAPMAEAADRVMIRREYARAAGAVMKMEEKAIVKEALSEYFLYTIEGTETIPDGWSKRLPSFSAEKIPVSAAYRFELERYGEAVVRFLSFQNDKSSRLGREPLPEGLVYVFQRLNPAGELRYLGRDSVKYIPVDQKVDLNLGLVQDVTVEPALMKYRTENHQFDVNGYIAGLDEVMRFRVKAGNYRPVPIQLQVTRNFPHQYWELNREEDAGRYEVIDLDTVRFTLDLTPNTAREFFYDLRLYEGVRRDRR